MTRPFEDLGVKRCLQCAVCVLITEPRLNAPLAGWHSHDVTIRISRSVTCDYPGSWFALGVLLMSRMLSKSSNIWDEMNYLNLPLNLGNEITPAVRLMNSVLRHPNKYSLIILTRSHAEKGRQGRLARSPCSEWGLENRTAVLGSFSASALKTQTVHAQSYTLRGFIDW